MNDSAKMERRIMRCSPYHYLLSANLTLKLRNQQSLIYQRSDSLFRAHWWFWSEAERASHGGRGGWRHGYSAQNWTAPSADDVDVMF